MTEISTVTTTDGFPEPADLRRRYEERSGRDTSALAFYEVLALWKAAIFLEGSYKRYLAGSTDDPFFGRLDLGVPALAETARHRAEGVT